jgi:hypothetical protein
VKNRENDTQTMEVTRGLENGLVPAIGEGTPRDEHKIAIK